MLFGEGKDEISLSNLPLLSPSFKYDDHESISQPKEIGFTMEKLVNERKKR
jgi:hypothetical protein